jgi:linearmycin/streptolysin S transport system ATP-binding protein
LPILNVQQLNKSYGLLRAVDGVSFNIDAGEIFGLLGPNGAGKSTTINIIATTLEADDGAVSVSGVPISRSAAYKRKIGYVPQEVSLAERLTARENLHFLGRLYDLGGPLLKGRTDRALADVGLSDRADDLVKTFSGGMKRRLNIAAALLHEPDLILMDEPTAGVDPQARAYIFEVVEKLATGGKAILYTTHYMEEAQRLCRRTAIIDHGKILAMGTLDELVRATNKKVALIVDALDMTPAAAEKLAAALGNVAWTVKETAAHLTVPQGEQVLLKAAKAAEALGLHPTALRLAEPNLEDVFLELTGRALRD